MTDQTTETLRPNPARVLHFVMRNLEVSDADMARKLAEASGPDTEEMTRQAIHNRRTGKSRIAIEDIDAMARVLDVPLDLFLGTPGDAISWLLENKPKQFRCTEPTSPQTTCNCAKVGPKKSTVARNDVVSICTCVRKGTTFAQIHKADAGTTRRAA